MGNTIPKINGFTPKTTSLTTNDLFVIGDSGDGYENKQMKTTDVFKAIRSINLGVGMVGSGSSAPSLTKVNNTAGYKFLVNDNVYLTPFEMPYDRDASTSIKFKIHFYSTNTTASRYVKFQISHTCTGEGTENVNVSDGNLNTGDILLSTTAYRLTEATITMTGACALDDVVSIVLTRIASSGTAPASPTDNPVVMSCEIEYQTNRLGEAV